MKAPGQPVISMLLFVAQELSLNKPENPAKEGQAKNGTQNT
jgi:hypothetical protein